MEGNIILAFGLTLFAGLSTGVGGLIAVFSKKTNKKLLSVALGFSAGVMIYVSFMEIMPKAIEAITTYYGSEQIGNWLGVAAFFAGILLIGVIDKLVPSHENPHELYVQEDIKDKDSIKEFKKLKNVGVMTAIAIAIHNFPEGFATFLGTLADPSIGVAIAIAIAIHNIPEGLAVAIPIFYATGSRSKALGYSLFSGLVEPLG
ncbi:zinc transporter ZupT, partial [Candidatus Peregrinibacteria bacterium]|nr:zinc transporter ZupT [Candidatus Peregrinibacteria bacterium]